MKAISDFNPRPIRSREPLTLDQIRSAAPSVFAPAPHASRSSHYSYIPTIDVVNELMRVGFQPFAASQSHTSIVDKREHTKHMIRFRMHDTALAVGDVFPELVLTNSHDGSSAYNMMAGLFRLVCTNGMTVADSLVSSVHVRHSGKVLQEVATGSIELVTHMPKVIDAVARWRDIQLSAAEQSAFAEAAHVVRFADAEGQINTPIQPKQLLTPRRYDDNRSDLWSVFNRVQENVIKGGLSARRGAAQGYQKVTTRGVKGIDQDVRLNRALWTLGERMAELRSVN